MSFDVTIQHDLKKLRRSLTALEVKAAPQATVKTINRVAASAKVASAKHIAPQLGSRQAGVKRRIAIRRASFKMMWATLVASGRQLQLIEYVVGSKKPTQQAGGKRGPVKTKVFGKSKTYKKAFIAPIRSGSSKTTVYTRKGKSRLPVRMMHGPGIKETFKRNANRAVMEAKVRERLPIEFARNLAFYAKRIRSR